MNHRFIAAAAALLAIASSASAALVSRYTFEGNAADVVGSANLTPTGTVTYNSTGVLAGLGQAALVTNNPDDNSAALSYLSNSGIGGTNSLTSLSISIWFSESNSAGNPTLMVNRFNDIFAISGDAGAFTNLEFMTRGTAGTAAGAINNEGVLTATNATSFGTTWHNAVFVGGASSISYYLDGALVGSAAVTTTGTIDELFLFRGGANNSGNVRGWNGQIADLQIYNQNLTAQDAQFLASNPGQVVAVPEPSVALLGGLGMLGLMSRRCFGSGVFNGRAKD